MNRVFPTLVLCCAALGGCNADVPDEPATDRVVLTETIGTSQVPIDTTPQKSTLSEAGKAVRLVKAPSLRPATRDEIEDYNGTFRTEGSRDRLLARIRSASDEQARRQLVAVFERVTRNLSPETRGRANTKLAAALQGAVVLRPTVDLQRAQAAESGVGQ